MSDRQASRRLSTVTAWWIASIIRDATNDILNQINDAFLVSLYWRNRKPLETKLHWTKRNRRCTCFSYKRRPTQYPPGWLRCFWKKPRLGSNLTSISVLNATWPWTTAPPDKVAPPAATDVLNQTLDQRRQSRQLAADGHLQRLFSSL